jgi:hypothetical protein
MQLIDLQALQIKNITNRDLNEIEDIWFINN